MTRVAISPALLRAVVRLLERQIIDARKRELETIARRIIRRHQRWSRGRIENDTSTLIAIYRNELASRRIRLRFLELDLAKRRPLEPTELDELKANRALQRYITAALRRVQMMQVSPKQREVLERAVAGEDRIIPERSHYERSGRLSFVMPARRWFVPPGYVVPEGSAEHQACRTLANRGLLGRHGVPISKENPHGLGGYAITAKGRRAL